MGKQHDKIGSRSLSDVITECRTTFKLSVELRCGNLEQSARLAWSTPVKSDVTKGTEKAHYLINHTIFVSISKKNELPARLLFLKPKAISHNTGRRPEVIWPGSRPAWETNKREFGGLLRLCLNQIAGKTVTV